MVDIAKDNILTHSVLNFLRASFVGQIVFHKAITALNSKIVDDTYVEGAHRALDKVDPWLKEVYEGMPIISASWTAPETFEAIRAFGYLKEVKQDLDWLATQVDTALALPDLTNEVEAVRLLVATIVRTANVRATYLNGVGTFFSAYKDQERANAIAGQFEEARQYVQVAAIVFDTFNGEGPFEKDLVERLRKEASLCPADFRAQAHDAVILQNSFVKKFDYEHSEIAPSVAKQWKDANVPADIAGYWLAYQFTIEETVKWTEVGLGNASLAANWKRSGFDADTAFSWQSQGFVPAIARVWKEAGYDPARAAQFVSRGIQTPEKAVEPSEPPEVLE